ncbi:MAG: TrkH family potassium uptake protein [Gemmatimonadota bacterium]|nr:TrkH family potassium uptake protein [Gemmatimonadota bacterium]
MPRRHRGSHLSLGDVAHLVGAILLGSAGAMGACAAVGYLLGDGSAAPLALSALAAALVGGAARVLTHVPKEINFREGFVIVTFGWTAVALFGALPYLFSGTLRSPAAALFESMSGFTTTGSTVLTDIEATLPGILLWRSATQWLGGMGIIVLGIAILPYLGVGGMQLFRAEVPGPTPDRLRPRIRETAKLLWQVYAGLSALLILLLSVAGMSWFDALNHALTTMPTGGFSTRNDSMGAFSPVLQWIVIVFMYLAGINFTLHWRALSRGARPYLRDREWLLYTAIIAAAAVVVAWTLRLAGLGWEPTIRTALFQTVSIVTTTGYGTADYEQWIPFGQLALFLLFFVGGMAGSTGGGPKVIRVLLTLKHGFQEIRKQLHPRAVFVAKVGGTAVGEPVILNVLGFMLLYITLFGLGTLAMAAWGLSLPSAAGAAATAIGNIGPGLDQLGPTDHFGWLPAGAQLVLVFLMLVGRLEIYTVLLLFHPGLWRR